MNPLISKFYARYRDRAPDPGVCRITSIDWVERRITMSNGACSYSPTFDEVLITKSIEESHYDWLERNLPKFSEAIGAKIDYGYVVAHGDKCYSYRDKWEQHMIPFGIGVAIYLLTYVSPFSKTVRDTENGWVAPDEWVISFFQQNRDKLQQLI